MTRYAIFTDIYGNLEALEAILEFLTKQAIDEKTNTIVKDNVIDKYICCGDIVGFGPDPNECVKIIRDLDAICVMGDYDYLTSNKDIDLTMHVDTKIRGSLEWTRKKLKKVNASFLKSLSLKQKLEDIGEEKILICHGHPLYLDKFKPVREESSRAYMETDISQLFSIMKENRIKLFFHGHSYGSFVHLLYENKDSKDHISGHGIEYCINLNKPTFDPTSEKPLKLSRGIINVGRTSNQNNTIVMIYDNKKQTMEQFSVKYDYEITHEKTLKAKLCPTLM